MMQRHLRKMLLLGLLLGLALAPLAPAQDPSVTFRRLLRQAEVHLRQGTPAARKAAADVALAARRDAHAAGVYGGYPRVRCLMILWQCQSATEFGQLMGDPRYGDRAYLFGDRLQPDLAVNDADDRVRPLLLARARHDHEATIRLGRELGRRDDAYYLHVAEALAARGQYQEALAAVAKVFRKPDLPVESRAAAHDLEADCHLGLARIQAAAADRDKHLQAADKALVRASDAILAVDAHRVRGLWAEIRKDQGLWLEQKNLPEQAFLKYVESIEQVELARATGPDLFGTRYVDQDPERLAGVDGVLRTYKAAGYSITDALVLMDRLKSRDLLDWMAAPSKSQAIQGSIEMNRLLRGFPETCFLCYWVGAERVYLLAVTTGRQEIRSLVDLGERGRALQLVAKAHTQVSTPQSQPGPALEEASKFFLPAAVQPLLGVERVIVCPSVGLGRLPWPALPLGGTALGLCRQLVTVPSLTILRELSSRTSRSSGLVVVHANGEEEARRVARSYHVLATMQGPVATFDKLRTVLEAHEGHVGVVQLAVPAVEHLGFPSLSLVTLNDGPWSMASIGTLKLEGCLVVMSNCRFSGAAVGGKEINGLTWGPLAAGARAVVVSQWPVTTNATVELLDRFHQFRSQGHDDAEAMRQARQQLSATDDYRHPYYWAGFDVVGFPFAPRSRGYWNYLWLLAGAGILAGIYLLRRRR